HGGDAALAILREDANFDVLFCDLMMPGLSGPKFYRILQAEFPQLASRVIFITGGVFSDATQDFLDNSGAHCLYKPFSLDSVRDAIAGVQANNKAPGGDQSRHQKTG
ncbi:MAG: response regulator, partial [Myxococcales bacterium]|nr:response regulator [Myxococcales bacterium]